MDMYRAENRLIISVDGEGEEYRGRHAYTLLAAADDRGFRKHIRHDGSIREASYPPGTTRAGYRPTDVGPNYGLPTKRCLDFLLDELPNVEGRLVISFSFTYDITKILHDLPWKNQLEFASQGRTQWGEYTIRGLPRKFFDVSRGDKRIRVWDAFTYWQMAFAKALNQSLGLFSEEQRGTIDFIAQMKAERGHLEELPPEQVLEYCYDECEFLSIMYRDFLMQCQSKEVDLTQKAHSGPGALADAFFDREQISEFMPWYPHPQMPSGVPRDVAIHSYYGGRFETAILGPVGDVIEYDIHSAYPAIAVTLPCLACGTFRQVNDYVPGAWGFYYVGSKTSGPWAPFPFRSDGSPEHKRYLNGASKGSIVYAHGGLRWVTGDEVRVARAHWGKKAIPVIKGWVFVPGCTHKPFEQVERLYLQRMHFKELDKNTYAGLVKVLKLIINSIYGKLAQSIGVKLDPTTQHHITTAEAYIDPTYQCYIWASWITGGTRAKVLEAAIMGGENVVSIATDGILTTKPLPLPVTDYDLGTWEREDKRDCWLGMPGIYAFGSDESDKDFKRRGLDGRYFPKHHLRREYENGEWIVYPLCPTCKGKNDACPDCHGGLPEARAFMPQKLAVTRNNALDVMGEWISMPKQVRFLSVQHKRHFPDDTDPFMPHDGGPMKLTPMTVPDDLRSMPYQPKQTWENLRDVYLASGSYDRTPIFDYDADEDEIGLDLEEKPMGDLDMPMWDETDSEEWS